jgi:hypothetical protein
MNKNKILDHQQYGHLTINSWETDIIKDVLNYRNTYKHVEEIYDNLRSQIKMSTWFIRYINIVGDKEVINSIAMDLNRVNTEKNVLKMLEIYVSDGFVKFLTEKEREELNNK